MRKEERSRGESQRQETTAKGSMRQETTAKAPNRFRNFHERKYDYDALEEELTGTQREGGRA